MLPYSYKFPPDPMTCTNCGKSVAAQWVETCWVFLMNDQMKCIPCHYLTTIKREKEEERKRRGKYQGVKGLHY